MQSNFIWHDLMTPNAEAAMRFYADVLGWTYQAQPNGDTTYHVAHVGSAGVGGMMQTPKEMSDMPTFWSGYVHTPDVDAVCTQIKALGGAVHRGPWDVPGMLRMAVVSDPTGAVFNIMQPLSSADRSLPPHGAQGTVGWNELYAGDVDVAWPFYATLFGWTQGSAVDMGPLGTYRLFRVGDKDIGGMMRKVEALPRPVWFYYFCVDGIDAAVARVRDAGGTIVLEPHEVPGGSWITTAKDPLGAYFSLTSAAR
jgi:hypothetical protein